MSTITIGRERQIWLTALPLVVMWAAMPVWWALGVQKPVQILVTIPLVIWMIVQRKSLELPLPYLVFSAFLGWVLLSASSLTTVRYGIAWGMRLALYLVAFAIGVFVWNALRRDLSPRVLIWGIVAFWAAAILLSFPGMAVPGLSFTSPFEALQLRTGVNIAYLHDISHPQFSEWDAVYGVARPSPLFPYTNDWGAAIGVMTPVAMYATVTTKDWRVRLLMIGMLCLSAIPILTSVNRGCWISLGVSMAYVVARRTLVFDLRPLGGLVLAAVAGFVIVMTSPLKTLIEERFAYSNTSTRETLYSASIRFAERSPIVGYGAPQSSAGIADSNDVSVGTHGQLWTLLVSQGFVGAALFIIALLTLIYVFRPMSGSAPEVWLHAVGFVVLIQLPFYDVNPDGLIVAFVCLSICALTAGRFAPAVYPRLAASDSDAAETRGNDRELVYA